MGIEMGEYRMRYERSHSQHLRNARVRLRRFRRTWRTAVRSMEVTDKAVQRDLSAALEMRQW